ncbi:hypothetical protein FACS1894159_01710 [Bacteroidia bacterium]|nr:hypothetical protein FACS1894159_01710 [Bacteroidia bacterium]
MTEIYNTIIGALIALIGATIGGWFGYYGAIKQSKVSALKAREQYLYELKITCYSEVIRDSRNLLGLIGESKGTAFKMVIEDHEISTKWEAAVSRIELIGDGCVEESLSNFHDRLYYYVKTDSTINNLSIECLEELFDKVVDSMRETINSQQV